MKKNISISLITILIFLATIFTLKNVFEKNTREKITGNDGTKKIVYELVEKYFKSYYLSDTPKELKLKYHKIEEIQIISKNETEIRATFKGKIIPVSLNYAWASTTIDYYLTIEKIDNKWGITRKATSP